MYMIGNGTKTEYIFRFLKKLPYFCIDDILPVEKNKTYLIILLSRYAKSGKIIRLKKGLYTTKEYIEEMQKNDIYHSYLEFISNILYPSSYLSLEYILSQNNIIPEFTTNFISVTINKTKSFSNPLGNFFYHKIKKELFTGFDIYREGDFTILKATKAKALFDFLYFRKNILVDGKSIEELRLNLDVLGRKDIKELEKYINLEGSRKMEDILTHIIKLWKK